MSSSSYYTNSLGTSYDSSLDVEETFPPPAAEEDSAPAEEVDFAEESCSSANEEEQEEQQQQTKTKAPLPSIANSLLEKFGEDKMSSPPSLRELAMALDMQSEAQWQLARVAAGSLKR